MKRLLSPPPAILTWAKPLAVCCLLLGLLSCEKDVPLLPAEEIISVGDQDIALRSSGGSEGDCRCYMQILSVENAPDRIWGLLDDEDFPFPTYEVVGDGDTWQNDSGIFVPFPSSSKELASPSFGEKTFRLGVFVPNDPSYSVDPDFKVNVKVECISNGSAPIALRTKTHFHTFRFGDGVFLSSYVREFDVEFDCHRAESPGG